MYGFCFTFYSSIGFSQENTGLGVPYLLNLGLLKKAPSNINNIAESIPIASWLNNIETGMDNAASIKKTFINI
jgi:hypothetical protein